jgi:hypothetical protein
MVSRAERLLDYCFGIVSGSDSRRSAAAKREPGWQFLPMGPAG